MGLTLILLQTASAGASAQPEPLSTVALFVVVAVLIALIGGLAFLMIRTGVGTKMLAKDERSWLDYGNLYIVALGIGAVVIGFLVMLLFLDRFDDVTQALGFLTALFGAIVGLVGTYFGVKNSADAREGAENVALNAGVGSTAPAVTVVPAAAPADATQPIGVGTGHEVTATVISVDGTTAAGVPVTFTVIAGPDAGTTGVNVTDELGRATFELLNNGTAGTDTIEATSLGGKGTATVTFT